MDARTAQTQQRLRDAVLALARSRAPEDIPVAELTAAAGISRVTFYDHHRSVTGLLVAVLAAELDAIRASSTEERGVSIPLDAHLPAISIRRVAAHVDAHRAIYEHALLDGGTPAIERALREHFEASLLALPSPARLPAGIRFAAAVRSAAYGMVGAISAVLEHDRGHDLDADDLIAHIAAMQPSWW